MRLFIAAILLLSVGSLVSAAYSNKYVENFVDHAHRVSRAYALGDSGDASGWRECQQVENQDDHIGLACEGVRSIQVHGGRMFDVNYFCEFRFRKMAALNYEVELESCQ